MIALTSKSNCLLSSQAYFGGNCNLQFVMMNLIHLTRIIHPMHITRFAFITPILPLGYSHH